MILIDLAHVLMRRSCRDSGEALSKRSSRDLVEVLNRRFCGDPCETISHKRSLREDLAAAMY